MTAEQVAPAWQDGAISVYLGDSLEVMRSLPDASVDAVVTDPPYGLAELKPAIVAKAIGAWLSGDRSHVPDGRGFMGRSWDAFTPPPAVWDECMRVLKPGGHLLVFAGSRTVDLMGLAIRLAGFEIRDTITWMYGSGFPKSLDVSKAIDRAAGAEREVVGEGAAFGRGSMRNRSRVEAGYRSTEVNPSGGSAAITAPATDDARHWQGWGTALKPASEPIVVARKPLAGTVAQTVLAHGTGALNNDVCRVGTQQMAVGRSTGELISGNNSMSGPNTKREIDHYVTGRWPSNVVLSHAATPGGVDLCADGCVPGCPVAELDGQSGVSTSPPVGAVLRRSGGQSTSMSGPMVATEGQASFGRGDSGGASRFFPTFRYEAKAPSSERPRIGKSTAQDITNNRCAVCGRTDLSGSPCTCPEPEWIPRDSEVTAHPTVKPLGLMRWLVRLVTPPGGTVLDPFLGSGTTAEACLTEGKGCVGIERDAGHLTLIRKRLDKPIQLGLEIPE